MRRRVFLSTAAAAGAALACPALAQTQKVGPRELAGALASAKGGETLVLTKGRYGALAVAGRRFAAPVTLVADQRLTAVFPTIQVQDSSNLRIDGVHVSSPSNGGAGGAIVSIQGQSQEIAFLNSEINGRIDGRHEGFFGLHAKGDLSDLTIAGNYMHDVKVGAALFGVRGLAVQDNRVDRILGDSFKFSGIQGGMIARNMGARSIFQVDGEHYDFMQFQGDSQNVTVRGNLSMPATLTNVQGVFFNNGRYRDIVVERNVIVSSQLRGVSMRNGTNTVARDNTLINIPGFGAKSTKAIDFNSYVGNIQTSHPKDAGHDANLTMQNTRPGSAFYYGNYFANPEAGPQMSLRDLLPVRGSLAEQMGAVGTVEAFLKRYG